MLHTCLTLYISAAVLLLLLLLLQMLSALCV
jgi:hypothetical protein